VAGDTLASLGQKLTDLFASVYAGGNPDVSLGFLPFCAAVPDDIVQGGIVNPARMGAFLTANFDYPFALSPGQNTAFGQDDRYGPASQIYSTAATLAQPAFAPGSDAAKRLSAEIAMAQSVLSPAGVAVGMTCEPDDWVATGNTGYWTVFDSTQTQSLPQAQGVQSGTAGTGTLPARVFNPQIWTIRSQAATPLVSGTAPHTGSPAVSVVSARPMLTAMAVRPEMAQHVMIEPRPQLAVMPVRPILPIHVPVQPAPSPPPAPAPAPPAAPTSTVTIHFEHMAVTIGYTAAGLSIWDGVFLADQGWYISGMARGGLLPAPGAAAATGAALVYGLPISIVVVRNVTIGVNWSGQDQASLGTSGGFLGPFALGDTPASTAPDGTSTYTRLGMQVVAVLCSHLPVLPPIDAPDLAPQVQANGAVPGTSQPQQGAAAAPGGASASPAPASGGANQTPTGATGTQTAGTAPASTAQTAAGDANAQASSAAQVSASPAANAAAVASTS
jgi:hypothetical protein